MKSLVSAGLATMLLLPALSCAQEGRSAETPDQKQAPAKTPDQKPDQKKAPDDQVRRLETVTWNSVNHELSWVIARGDKEGATFKPDASETYQINMDRAVMSFHGQKRGFSKEEAANVHVLMDVISKYAIDSTVWWDEGHGIPLNKDGQPKEFHPRHDQNDNDNVAILHVAATAPPALNAAQVDRQIQALQNRLIELRRLRRQLGTLQMASSNY